MIIVLRYVRGIDLSNRNLDEVPANIPPAETEVFLQENKISIIRANAFVTLTELKNLQLLDNDIETIEPGAFNGLAKLTNLNLVRNKLTHFLDISILSGLSALHDLHLGANMLRRFDTTQLGVLGNLDYIGLDWIFPKKITPFPNMPKLRNINFRGNGMVAFSSDILKKLSGLEILRFGYNKFSSLPKLGGVEEHITELELMRNRFLHIPDLSKHTNLVKLDLADNYITLVPEESLSHLKSGTVNLEGNPVICVSELCWLVSGSWPFAVQLTCPDGTPWAEVDQTAICEGKTAQLAKTSYTDHWASIH